MNHYNTPPSPEPLQPIHVGRAAISAMIRWREEVEQPVIEHGHRVYGFRGTGTTGGMPQEAADRALETIIFPRLYRDLKDSDVLCVFDGDEHNPARPDIGYIVGEVLHEFRPKTKGQRQRLKVCEAQQYGWYPEGKRSNHTNAYGEPYPTYVFEADYPGAHNAFTQSETFARYPRYGQLVIGAAGLIAAGQMEDYWRKARGDVRIELIRAHVNEAVDADISHQLAQAATTARAEKLRRMQEQREQFPYGMLMTSDGNAPDPELIERWQLEQEARNPSHELVVLWERGKADMITIANCKRISLYSPEMNAAFESATQYIKTAQIRARKVPAGTTETVVVRSGATRDTAIGDDNDWIATSLSGEDYVVHGDFLDIYEPAGGDMYRPKPDPRKLIRVTGEPVIFEASWKQKQAVVPQGVLVERTIRSGPNTGKTERYGSSELDAADYKPYVR